MSSVRNTSTQRQSVSKSRQRKRSKQGGINWKIVALAISVVLIVGIIVLNTINTSSQANVSASASLGEVTETSVGASAPNDTLAVGTTAPDLQWTINGQPASIAGNRGSVMLVEFFATWCPHCQAEVPVISSVYRQFEPQGLKAIAFSASPVGQDQRTQASMNDVASYMNRYGATYPHAYDPRMIGAQRYGIRSFPTIFLIDKSGVIRHVYSGEVSAAELTTRLTALLAG